jgi:transcriptional regulator with XRE-family HTH domain
MNARLQARRKAGATEPQQLGMEQRIATGIRQRREALGLTVNDLAERSGVSRAMISKIERFEASPTASLLGRLCNALGMTLSSLIASAESAPSFPVNRARQQLTWRDPQTGLRRTMVSPVNTGSRVEIVQIELPAGAAVEYDEQRFAQYEQHIVVLDGTLTLGIDGQEIRLDAGDCVHRQVGPGHRFANHAKRMCRYLVVISR